jgi:hypothetical protein
MIKGMSYLIRPKVYNIASQQAYGWSSWVTLSRDGGNRYPLDDGYASHAPGEVKLDREGCKDIINFVLNHHK